MAKLSDSSRELARARVAKSNRDPLSVTRSELRTVVNTLDDFIDENVLAFKALLDASGSTLTDKQLDLMLAEIATRRMEERL